MVLGVVRERGIEATVVVEFQTLGDGDDIGKRFNEGVTADVGKEVVVVLDEPGVWVVGGTNTINGGYEAIARAEVTLNVDIALGVAVESGEGCLAGVCGDGAKRVDVSAVGDGPLGGSGSVLPGDGHGSVVLPKGVEGMDGGKEDDVEGEARAIDGFVGGEGDVGNPVVVVVVDVPVVAPAIAPVFVERELVADFGIAAEPETKACGGAYDKGGGVA